MRESPVEQGTTDLARRAVADSRAGDPTLMDGYLDVLAGVCSEGRRLTRPEVDHFRAAGLAAAERGVSLGVVVDLYLSATWVSWPHLPRAPGAPIEDVATAVLRAANDAVGALADGYEKAQRSAIRQQEALRREFIDDLLNGTSDPTVLPARAAQFGLELASTHLVAIAATDTPVTDADESTRTVEAALLGRFGARTVLVTTKDNHLVCVAPGADPEAAEEFAAQTAGLLAGQRCRVGVSRPHGGPGGVAQSYREARDVLDLARLLDLQGAVLYAADLLVYQVLFRDRPAITDLVTTVLGPLQASRSGAEPLLRTLEAYFDAGSAVAAASRLHLGVRTVTYRLQRIRELTGHNPTDPTERFVLQAAVLGARMLTWPPHT